MRTQQLGLRPVLGQLARIPDQQAIGVLEIADRLAALQ